MVFAGGFVGGHDNNGTDDDLVVDYKGNPVDKSRTGGWLGAGLIAGTELAERVGVMGVSTNMVTYLIGPLHLSNAKSANIVTNFMGTLNLLALLGGFVADAKLGRYLTIVASATIAAVGLSLLAASTAAPGMRPPPCTTADGGAAVCVPASGGQMALLYVALYTIAVGAGGLKANVSGLGTDQFDGRDPREGRAVVFFFSRFYFWVSLGSLFAATVLVYVQDNVGRGWGYGLSAAVMVVATVVFVAGTPRYRYRRPHGSPLTVIGRVLWAAWKNRKLPCPADPSELHGFHKAKVPHTDRLRFLDKAAIVDADLASEHPAVAVPTLTEAEEVKMVAKLLPIWSTCILFWTVYTQTNTFTIEQASRMDRRVGGGGGGFVVPAGSMPFFLFLAILLFTSLNERLLVPLARRVTGRREGLTSLQRVATGLVLSTLAMAAAALVEKKRRDASSGGTGVAITAFWLVPQFFLVGASEAFGYVGLLEFFIREAPERMKSMSTGLFLTTLSMGNYLSSVLVAAVGAATRGTWVWDNLDDGRLDLFYWMLAVLGVFNFVGFFCFARRHEYKREAPAAAITAITAAVELTDQPEEEEAVKVAVAVKMIDV